MSCFAYAIGFCGPLPPAAGCGLPGRRRRAWRRRLPADPVGVVADGDQELLGQFGADAVDLYQAGACTSASSRRLRVLISSPRVFQRLDQGPLGGTSSSSRSGDGAPIMMPHRVLNG